MLDKKRVIAAQVQNNKIVAIKTLDEPSISYEQVKYNIVMGKEYFTIVENIEYDFKINDEGTEIIKPPIDVIKKLPKF